MSRFRLAALGGTFDRLHLGHQALLASAFRVGDEVAIGLTTDRFLSDHPKPVAERIQRYATRHAALVRYLERNYPRRSWRVVPLENRFGRSVDPEVDVLVVSTETKNGGRAVNRERRRLGRRPVRLVTVPLVLADDLGPVSSRRVRAHEIRPDGRRISPIRVALVTSDPRDREPAERALRHVFPHVRVEAAGFPERSLEGRADLELRVRRRRPSGWRAVERSVHVRLRPRSIPGRKPAELERGLVALLRPRQQRKLFGAPHPGTLDGNVPARHVR